MGVHRGVPEQQGAGKSRHDGRQAEAVDYGARACIGRPREEEVDLLRLCDGELTLRLRTLATTTPESTSCGVCTCPFFAESTPMGSSSVQASAPRSQRLHMRGMWGAIPCRNHRYGGPHHTVTGPSLVRSKASTELNPSRR